MDRLNEERVVVLTWSKKSSSSRKNFKSRIILQGPGKPEGQVLADEAFTVTRNGS